MRLKNIKNAANIVNESSYVISNVEEYKSDITKVFDNANDQLMIEIGMGKGDFIINTAINNPSINYIGIEKYPSVLVSVVKKLNDININNLKIICMDAKNIEDVFKGNVDALFLNFSDPWPKNKHSKRRLTSEVFLKYYDNIFKNEAHIFQKTDNIDLFHFSLESFVKYGYIISDLSFNYHKSHKNTVKTEYEEKFSSLGFNINYCEVKKHM